MIDIVKEISPNAWQHVRLIGAFSFEQTESQIDINALAARYAGFFLARRYALSHPGDFLNTVATIASASPNQIVKPTGRFAETLSDTVGMLFSLRPDLQN